ncbi:MAG TPA: NAD-dependent epimerase/dehydratase family protein [Bryobacteraceae bacterium]|nr:NAD-dependent epimerase/dehydratase family protein [Bryobacteraceae bacterium]
MRILVIGGTGFIGRYVVEGLILRGHHVTVYHRGRSQAGRQAAAGEILGDRTDLPNHIREFERLAPEIVLDTIPSSGRQAEALMNTFRGIAGRVVALSSQDVYRACGILHGLEPGPLQPLPLTEDSDLRTRLNTYPPETVRALKEIFAWLDDEYDKIPVEQAVMGDSQLPGTVLRLPMVYGPGDPLHRCFPILKRIDDGRRAILIPEDAARWRGPRGYVENVAAGIVLAVTAPDAAGRIYNLAEPEAFSEIEWAEKICHAARWHGTVIAVPADEAPAHLRVRSRYEQYWVVNSDRIRRELGYSEPVASEVALERTIVWERANPRPKSTPNSSTTLPKTTLWPALAVRPRPRNSSVSNSPCFIHSKVR